MDPIVVKRNDVGMTLSETAFGKRSPRKGSKFFTPVLPVPEVNKLKLSSGEEVEAITGSSLQALKWVGLEDLIQGTNKWLRQIFAGIYEDNIDEKTGQFNLENYLLDAADFAAGVDRLSDIEEELENLQATQQEMVLDEDFGSRNEKDKEIQEKLIELNMRVRDLRVKKGAIEAKYKDRAEKRKAKKLAEEAAAAKRKAEQAAEPAAVAA